MRRHQGLAFLHHEPTTLFFGEVEFLRSGDFCGCPVWCAHVSKELLGTSGPSIPTARSKKRGLCLFEPWPEGSRSPSRANDKLARALAVQRPG